jgi:hypothetical protein
MPLYKVSYVGRLRRFVIELVLLLSFLMAWWYLGRFVELFRIPLPPFSIARASGLCIVLTLFFAIVFYGTSFEITPLRIVTVFFAPFVRIFLRRDSSLRGLPKEVVIEPAELIQDIESIPEVETRPVVAADPVGTLFDAISSGAGEVAKRMERRTNTYLVVGVAMGVLGLVFWWISLPHVKISTPWDFVQQGLPRLTVLLFIELLAGFFLRQYRIGVEDFKYFLELKRRADHNRVCYSILDKLEEPEALRDFARAILETMTFDTKLKAGETTTVLETIKSEQNLTLSAMKVLGDNVEQLAKMLAARK